MNNLTKQILDNHKEHWYSLRDAGFIKNLNQNTIAELERIYKQEIDSKFFVNKWCNSCVAEMLKRLYLAVDYDNYKEPIKEFAEVIQTSDVSEGIEATFVNNFDPENVNKELPKKRGRKKRK